MPTKTELASDFPQLKRTLAGSNSSEPVNCGVLLFDDGTAAMRVDRTKSGKALAALLQKEGRDAGLERRSQFFGTAYADQYPGTLSVTLNKKAPGLDTRLRVFLRGSGFGKVEIAVAAGDDEASDG